MHPVIETRLTGSQATLAGVTRHINRQVGCGPFARVELRYSTQAGTQLVPADAAAKIKQLLREQGMAEVAVSVRAHDGPLDDATGEHLVRLYPAERRGPAEDDLAAADSQPSAVRAWLGRWLPGARRAAALATPQAQAEPRMPAAEAAAHLRAAVTAAAKGHAAQGRSGPWEEAEVLVRLAALDTTLRPLVEVNLAHSARSLAQQLASQGQRVAPGFAVRYTYRAPATGEGTSYASDSDLEVLLNRAARPAGPPTPPVQPMPQVRPQKFRQEPSFGVEPSAAQSAFEPTALPPQWPDAEITLLPQSALRPALVLRVLGTLDSDFDTPLELRFATLPARIDRTALARAGLGARHPELLAVASNRAALVVESGPDGCLQVLAAQRDVPGGAPLPMYFDAGTLRPLPTAAALPADGLRVVVNDPAGLVDATTGRHLPALVLMLYTRPGG